MGFAYHLLSIAPERLITSKYDQDCPRTMISIAAWEWLTAKHRRASALSCLLGREGFQLAIHRSCLELRSLI
jgi:hypothetical protein